MVSKLKGLLEGSITKCSDCNYNKWSSLIGGILITMPLGLTFFWGNLYVYAVSFFIIRLDEHSGVQATWILTLKASLTATVGLFVRFMHGRIGKRTSVFFGMALLWASYALSYWAIQHSYLSFALIFGALYGLGDGMILFLVMDFTLDWINKEDAGCYLSAGYSGMCLGAVVANQFIARYINPQNIQADFLVGHSLFFSDDEILDRTPTAFLYLAAGSFIIQLTGFLLLRSKRPEDVKTTKEDGFVSIPISTYGTKQLGETIAETTDIVLPPGDVNICYEEDSSSLTTRQMLRKPQFYLLYLTFIFNYECILLSNNYYKALGGVWIHDDRFLSNIGSVTPVVSTLTSVFWGFLMDKLALKTVLVSLSASLSLMSALYYFVPALGKGIFCVYTLIYVSVASSAFSVYSISSVKAFGKTHQSSNFSVLYTATLACLAFSPMCEAILLNLGWFYMFLTPAVMNALSMICFVLFFNDKTLWQ